MIRFLQSGNKAAKYLLGGLLTILSVSMCAYLIPGFMSDTNLNRAGVVAKLGSQEISTQEVQNFAQRMMEQQQASRPGQSFEGLRFLFVQQAVKQLVRNAELRYESERMGLSVSDQELRDVLHTGQFGEMFFRNGNWVGEQEYQNIVNNYYRMSVDEFERELRSQLLTNKLITAVTAGVTVSPAEIERSYKEQNTKVKFDYAVLSLDDLQKQINPTDAELQAYFEANKARYQNSIPEKRQVRYFLISEQAVAGKVTITPTDLEGYYRKNDQEFRVPDRVKVRHILIKTPPAGPDGKVDQKAVDAARAKAADILKQIKAGADFAELAKKNSDDPGSKDKGGELDWIVKDQTVPEFEKAAFSMKNGQISDLVQTSYGFHIIQTEENETAHKKSLAEVKDQITSILKQQGTAKALDDAARDAQQDAQKSSLEKAAAKYGAPVNTTGLISRTDTLAGVGAASDVMNDIFNATQKAGVQSARTSEGYAIFEIEKIVPPATPAFDAIKDRVAGDFKSERSGTLLAQKTTDLGDRAHASHDLRKAAKELGATVKTSELVGRGSQVPDIGSMSGPASAAFSMKPGDISGPLNVGRNGVVLAITDRQEPSLTSDDFTKAKDGLLEQLVQEKRQQAMNLFLSNLDERLTKEGKVKYNKTTLDGLIKGTS